MDVFDWIFEYGWIPMIIMVVGTVVFLGWIIVKLMQHFGVI